LLIVAIVFATWLILRAAVKSNRKYPISERACLLILRFAAWAEAVATAYDAAILRYRMERRAASIEMASTAERMMAEEEADTGRALDYMDQNFGPFPSQSQSRAARTLDEAALSLANGEPVLATPEEIREALEVSHGE
jgi:hypothetical protein